jgi:hypothetical protein
LRGFLGTRAGADQPAWRSLGTLGDDVDHTVDGIGAPHGTAGSADHLDPVDIFQRHVLLIPVDAGAERAIDASSVYHRQHLVSILIGEAPNTDGPGVRIYLSDVYPWHHPQQIRNIGGARLADIFLIDDVYGGSGLGKLLFSLGNGGDLDIHEIFQAVLSEVVGRRDLSGDGDGEA